MERATRVLAEAWWEKDADGERAGTCVEVTVGWKIFKGKLLKCCWMKQMTSHVPLPMFWLLKCFT